jgi:hypothetical protein
MDPYLSSISRAFPVGFPYTTKLFMSTKLKNCSANGENVSSTCDTSHNRHGNAQKYGAPPLQAFSHSARLPAGHRLPFSCRQWGRES